MENFSHNTQTYLEDYHFDLEQMINSMKAVPINGSISHNFIVQMIPHHMMAINMCQNLLQYTTSIGLQNMAHDIITEQRESIWKMHHCLEKCSLNYNSGEQVKKYQECFVQIADTMFYQMERACQSNSIDKSFCREMIPHHMGALEMCENVLRFSICTELRPIIDSIIRMQTKGIKELRYMLTL